MNLRKTMQVTLCSLAILLLFSCSKKSEGKYTEWVYETNKNEMTDVVRHFASKESKNTVQLTYPINRHSSGLITLIKTPTDNIVMLTIPTGQFESSSTNDGNILVRFDDGTPENYSYEDSADGDTSVIFLYSPIADKFITNFKNAKEVKIECNLFKDGKEVLKFDVDNLKWD